MPNEQAVIITLTGVNRGEEPDDERNKEVRSFDSNSEPLAAPMNAQAGESKQRGHVEPHEGSLNV